MLVYSQSQPILQINLHLYMYKSMLFRAIHLFSVLVNRKMLKNNLK